MSTTGISTLTYFNSTSTTFKGVGVNLRLLDNDVDTNIPNLLSDLNISFVRVLMSTPDPGVTALNIENYSDMDIIWSSAPNATDASLNSLSTNETFFSGILALNFQYPVKVIISVLSPVSWLYGDTNALTSTRNLTAYANYLCSCIAYIRSINGNVDYVELFSEPDKDDIFGHVSPMDLVYISTIFRTISTERNLSQNITVLAPSLSHVVATDDSQEPYTQEFIYASNNIRGWSIHANEHEDNLEIANAGTWESRMLLKHGLEKNVSQFNAVKWQNDRIVTSFSTISTKFSITGEDLGNSASDSKEFTKKIVDNFCHVVNNYYTAILFSNTTPYITINDHRSLYKSDGTARPVKGFIKQLCDIIPRNSVMYRSEEINRTGDKTIKCMFMTSNGNKIIILLSRPVIEDELEGELKIVVHHPLWSTNYSVSNITITNIDNASNVQPNLTLLNSTSTISQGVLTIKLSQVPYDCALIISADVTLNIPEPTPLPDPSPPDPNPNQPSQVILDTIIQVPVNYSTPTLTNYVNGTIYYDLQQKKLRVFFNGVWISTTNIS